LNVEPGSSESIDAWRDFLEQMAGRGLRAPSLLVSDGGAGLIGAVELVFSRSARQRCLIHCAKNVLAKVPKHAQVQVKKDVWAIWNGTDDAGETEKRVKAFSAKWKKLSPAAVAYLEDDLGHLTTYLRFPKEHWTRIRHCNFIERTFGETRRRVKVMGRLPGERSCLSLVWAVLERASRGWRGVEMTPKVVRELQLRRHELLDPRRESTGEEVVPEAVTSAAKHHQKPELAPRCIYTTSGTPP